MNPLFASGVFESPAVKGSVYIAPEAAEFIVDPGIVPLIVSRHRSKLVKPAKGHGRSFADPKEIYVRNREGITDENGWVYGAISVKGCGVSDPYVSYSSVEPSSARVNGMMDFSTSDRVVRASKALRAAGVMCEWPIYVAKPKVFPIPYANPHSEGKRVTNAIGYKYKQSKLVDIVMRNEWARLTQTNDEFEKQELRTALRMQTRALEGLSDLEYGVMYRACITNYRLSDYKDMDEAKQIQVLADLVETIKNRAAIGTDLYEDFCALDMQSITDRQIFLYILLPELIGKNVRTMLEVGISHGYLHSGNLTLAGEIVDLDSAEGKGVYDDEPEPSLTQKLRDVDFMIDALTSFYPEDWIGPAVASAIRSYIGVMLKSHEFTDIEKSVMESYLCLYADEDERDSIALESPTFIASHPYLAAETVALCRDIYENTDGEPAEVRRSAIQKVMPYAILVVYKKLKDEGIILNKYQNDSLTFFEANRIIEKIERDFLDSRGLVKFYIEHELPCEVSLDELEVI